MLSASAKKTINIILVSIVIVGMIASYLFGGSRGALLNTPSSAPTVSGPTDVPSQNGPSSPPPLQ